MAEFNQRGAPGGATVTAVAEPKPFNPWPAAIFVILLCLAVLFLAPTFGVLLSSIKTTREIAFGQLWEFPTRIHLGNFSEVIFNPAVHRYFVNTFLVTVPATALSIAFGVLAGYVFASSRSGAGTCCFWPSSRGCFSRRRSSSSPCFACSTGLA